MDRADLDALLAIVRLHLRGPAPHLSAFRIAHDLETALTVDTSANGNPKPAVGQTEWDEWVSVAEAARLLDCSERRARQLAPSIGGKKRGGTWWIPRSALPED